MAIAPVDAVSDDDEAIPVAALYGGLEDGAAATARFEADASEGSGTVDLSRSLHRVSRPARASVWAGLRVATLRRLVARAAGLDDRDVAGLCAALASAPALEEIVVPRNGVGDGGCERLARLVSRAPFALRVLDLGHNSIGAAGSRKLVTALASREESRSALERLGLAGSGADDAVCGVIAALVAAPDAALRVLDLADTNVSDGGARVIAAAARSNPSSALSRVSMSGARCGGAAAAAALGAFAAAAVTARTRLEVRLAFGASRARHAALAAVAPREGPRQNLFRTPLV